MNQTSVSYKEGLDLDFLWEYSMEHGARRKRKMASRRSGWPSWSHILQNPVSCGVDGLLDDA